MRRRLTVGIALSVLLIVGMGTALALTASSDGEHPDGASRSGKVEFLELDGEMLGDYHLSVDESTGRVWIVHMDNASGDWSAIEYDPRTRATTSHPLSLRTDWYISGPMLTPGAFVIHDGAGRLWLATYDAFGYFDTEGHEFVSVPLPTLDPAPATPRGVGDEFITQLWRDQAVTSMVLGSDGTVWLTRDYGRGLIRHEPSSGRTEIVDTPEDIEVPGQLTVLGDDVLVGEHRRPSDRTVRADEFGWWALSPDDDTWAEVVAEGLVAPNGERAMFFPYGMQPPLEALEPWDIIAIGPSGEVWYEKDGLDLARYDSESGQEVVYELPRTKALYRGGIAAGIDRSSSAFREFASPAFVSAVVDAEGDLWFSYIIGSARVGVAYR